MQRIPIFIRAAKQYNALWRSGELIAAKRIKPGDAITIRPRTPPRQRGGHFSDYVFKTTTTKFPLPRTNTLTPQPPRPAASNLCWKTIRRWQDAERL